MFAAALAGGLAVLAFCGAVRAFFPGRPSLSAELDRFEATGHEVNATDDHGLFANLAMRLLVQVKGETLSNVDADIRVAGMTRETFATEKLKAALAGGGLLAAVGFILGPAASMAGFLIALLLGLVAGYLVPDQDLATKAKQRRETFARALNSFVTLVAVSISGGAGLGSALAGAASLGDNWVFDEISATLREAEVRGTSPWTELEELGRELDVRPLVELAGALNLAGTDGAKVTESLYARADAGRTKELNDVRTEAEAKSSSLGLPVGCMLLGWAGFMGFAALSTLMGI